MFKRFSIARKSTKSMDRPPIPKDFVDAFSKFSNGRERMNVLEFHKFLVEHQGEVNLSLREAERIIEEGLNLPDGDEALTLDDFYFFLSLVDYNGPIRSHVHHDMNAPLAHYYIYTGHNSYLTGNQLSSDSSDVPIKQALQRGVRVIELDIWPNSSKDDINVLHGRTLTAPVNFLQCLKTINEYAFEKSPYPVIITLEDHLPARLQAKAAEMIIETFGDSLYYPKEEGMSEFPSPESLKHRILISTKPPSEKPRAAARKEPAVEAATSESETQDSVTTENEEAVEKEKKSAPEYKRLIAIHSGHPGKGKEGLTEALKVVPDNNVKRLSLSEEKLERAAETHGEDLVRFTQKNILRIYPKGTRVDSSNYKPQIAWMHGAQMVAFNMQGFGKELFLMHGVFRSNGGCGYLKKPSFLLEQDALNEVFSPSKSLPVSKTLKVKVYMGDGWSLDFSPTHFDTFSPPDFYTKVNIIGVPADCARKKTKTIDDNWCPVWNKEFEFPLTVPDLAVVEIEVMEYDVSERDDFGGQTYLSVSELKTGFRAIPLYDEKGEKYNNSKLFVRFEFE